MNLSICIPSNRPLAESRQTMESALALTQFEGIEVAVSDNSGDEQKETYFKERASPAVRYMRSDGADARRNWQYVRNLSTGKYVSIVSDDDLVLALPGANLAELHIPPGAIGVRPQMLMYTKGQGLYSLTNFAVTGPRAIDRIKDYFAKNGGANTTIFSAFRRDLICDVMDLNANFHPIPGGGYQDWPMVLGLLSSGEVAAHEGLAYVYNNSNWLSAAQIEDKIESQFVAIGLPGRTRILVLLLTGIDAFILIARESSNVASEEKLEAASYTLLQYLHAFARDLPSVMSAPETSDSQVAALNNMVASLSSPVDALVEGIRVIDQFLPGYGDKYHAYFRQAVGIDLLPRV